MPGLRSTFESPFTELVLEFVEYHMQQGVDHIFFGVDYEWGSRSMRKLELLLEQYITEGRYVCGREGRHFYYKGYLSISYLIL